MDDAITLRQLVKRYGDTTVVDEINLDIPEGAFVSLLGASGCGKTTTLRLIAGLETANSGRILFRGADITDVPPSHRDMRMMFQDYALFPNLSVSENVAFGLKLRSVRTRFEGNVSDRVNQFLGLVQLSDFGERMPHELSGGQRQRVALARALITDPAVVLFDEPLGALDAALRHSMQYELKRMHTEFGKTFVYVTHDQEEAMAMSDLIVVIKSGRILQLAPPEELYRRPNCRYVAEFIGSGNTLLDAQVVQVNGTSVQVQLKSGIQLVSSLASDNYSAGQDVGIHLRSDSVELLPERSSAQEDNILPITVVEHVFLGGRTEYHVRLDADPDTVLTVSRDGAQGAHLPDGTQAHVRIDPQAIGVLTQ